MRKMRSGRRILAFAMAAVLIAGGSVNAGAAEQRLAERTEYTAAKYQTDAEQLEYSIAESCADAEQSEYAAAESRADAGQSEYAAAESRADAGLSEHAAAEGQAAAEQPDDSIEDVLKNVDSVDDLTAAMEDSDMVDMETASPGSSEGTQTDPYSLKRVTLFADDVTQSYGASSVICYDKYGYYIFGFDTESDTEAAYYQMIDDYGTDRCVLDQVMYADDLLSDYSDEDPYKAVGWGTTYMGMDKLKSTASKYSVEAEVDVAVLDTGVNQANELFTGRINTDNSGNCYDSENPADYSDSLGHGSHVAGIVADATPDNVKLTILKCFSETGKTSSSVIQKTVMKAIDLGVDVINMSFCFYTISDENRAAIDSLITSAVEQNIVMCVAAGNSNGGGGIMDVDGNSYPADSSDVITVSALKKKSGVSDADKISDSSVEFDSSYSYYGDKIDFSAPGTKVDSAWMNGGYRSDSGTSMAAPYVTAAVSYVKMAEPDLTNKQVVDRLAGYSVDLGDKGKDIYYGYGCPYLASYFTDVYGGDLDDTPADCKVTGLTNVQGGLKLTWDSVAGADSYRIYRMTAGSIYTCVATVSGGDSRTYTDKCVESGTRYRYAVRAVAGQKTGKIANSKAALYLKQPVYTVKNCNYGINISWNRSAGAYGYKIYRKASGALSWSLYKAVPEGVYSYIDQSVADYKKYSYTVKAYNGYFASTYDTAGKAAYRIPDCEIEKLASENAGRMGIWWQPVSGATGYQIEYSRYSDFRVYTAVTLAGESRDKRLVTGLTSGRYYSVRMRMYKKIDGKAYYGDWSRSRMIKIK